MMLRGVRRASELPRRPHRSERSAGRRARARQAHRPGGPEPLARAFVGRGFPRITVNALTILHARAQQLFDRC